MRKISKCLFLIAVLFLFLVVPNHLVASAEIDPYTIKNKLECNSETRGNKFKIGMMGNYYKICLSNKIAYVYKDVKVLRCSETEIISRLGENGIQRTKSILDSEVVGFSAGLPRGYGYTLLYALGITNADKTSDSFNQTTTLSVQLNSSYDTIQLTEVVDSSTYFGSIDRSKTKATLYLVGDVVKVKLTVKQYQSWWWGDQSVYSEEVTAYVFCNLHDYVEYTS